MKSFVSSIALGSLVSLIVSVASAQIRVEYSENGEQLFREGVAQYEAGAYREAAVTFDRVLRDFPSGHRITAALIMRGKAQYQAGEILEATKTMKSFLSRFPASMYVADAEWTLGLVYSRIERYDEAMEMFLSAYRHQLPSSPGRLSRDLMSSMEATVDAHMSLAALRALQTGATTPSERAYLWLKIVEKEANAENTVAAGIALDSLTSRYPGHPFDERVARLRSRLAARNSIKLGALLPLLRGSDPSAAKEIGNEVYDGILFAVGQYGRGEEVRVSVSLETRDTERDPLTATKGARELCDDKDVIGIIGPVFSATVTPAAAVANAKGVPLITPTANANGLAASGKYIFQGNPDYDTRGRAMARYAVEKMGYRTVAVLAPIDAYGKFLAEAFVREAERLGARVLATEWYQRGSSDLKQPLAKIRRAGMLAGADVLLSFAGRMRRATLIKFMNLGVPLKRLDSLMNNGSVVSARVLLGPQARALLDSMAIPVVYDESKVDSLEYPVDAIQALYAPISGPEEIGVVSSQVVYFNFQTQLLGSGEWNNFAELNANRRYCEGIVFDTDTYVDTTKGNLDSFMVGFMAQFRKRPTKNTLFGYDVASMVLELVKNGATTRDALQKALSAVLDFRGYHSRIGFDGSRVNSWLTILRYADDTIRKVNEVRAERPPEGGEREEKRPK